MGRKEKIWFTAGILTILMSVISLEFMSEFWQGFWTATDIILVAIGAWYRFLRKNSPVHIDLHNLEKD